jgi:hypothetical protein
LLYHYLSTVDPDFRETFKVKADFDFQVTRSQENIVAYACFVSAYCKREGYGTLTPAELRGSSSTARASLEIRKSLNPF